MSFQSFVTEQLASINQRLNAIATNAKRIFELPVQTNLDPISKIHVSREGVSESLSISQIISAIENNTYNEIIAVGELSVVLNVVSGIYEAIVPAVPVPTWRINDVYYLKLTETKREIPFTATGLNRLDILVMNTANDIVRVPGSETAGIAIAPNKPIDTIVLTQIYVTDATVGDPEVPVDLSNKLDKGGYVGTAQTLHEEIEAISGGGATTAYVDAGDVATLNSAKDYTDSELTTKADLVSGLVPSSQLPSFIDDVIDGYKSGANFYKEVGLTTLITGEAGKIYIDLTTGQKSRQYRWSGSVYILITNGLIASTDDVPEGSNLYWTVARGLALVLTGLSTATGGAIVSTDSVLVAFGKVENRLSAMLTSIGLKENSSNKQNSLATDGTGVKFPTVDAVNAKDYIKEQRATATRYFWDGTQAQYDAIVTKNASTYYFITA